MHPPGSSPDSRTLLQRLIAPVVRVAIVLGGLLLMAGALLVGIVVATGVVVWALVRGRRPRTVDFRWGPGPHGRSGVGPAQEVEVIDIQAREVEGPPR